MGLAVQEFRCNNINEVGVSLPLFSKEIHMEKILMSLKEVCEYTGWGETKVREILKRPDSTFTVILGNRLYANKKKFDEYLDRCAKYHITV